MTFPSHLRTDNRFFRSKETPMTTDPKTITWRKGEPTAKLDAAPDGAPCTVVREWKDGKGRPHRSVREGYVSREDGVTYFTILSTKGFGLDVVSVSVTLPAPEWAEDRWVLFVNTPAIIFVTGVANVEQSGTLLAEREAKGAAVIIRLTEEQQDALDEAVAR